MSMRQRAYRVPLLVPVYLLVLGLGLVGGAVYLFLFAPEDQFTAGLSLFGGLTMLATTALLASWARSS